MPGLVVVNGALLTCDRLASCAQSPLTVPAEFLGPQVVGQPVATVQDHVVGKNIKPFPETCLTTGKPCDPQIPAPWTPGESAALIAAPIIAQSATLSCTTGCGKITIVNPGQSLFKVYSSGTNSAWTTENAQLIEALIRAAIMNNDGDIEKAFMELRDLRQNPSYYYDSNLAAAADYLRARWDVQRYGSEVERLRVEAYIKMKRAGAVPKEGPGPVSPPSEIQERYMRKGVEDETRQTSTTERAKDIMLAPFLGIKSVFDEAEGKEG